MYISLYIYIKKETFEFWVQRDEENDAEDGFFNIYTVYTDIYLCSLFLLGLCYCIVWRSEFFPLEVLFPLGPRKKWGKFWNSQGAVTQNSYYIFFIFSLFLFVF